MQQGLPLSDVADWKISSQHLSKSSDVHYLYLQQQHKGIPIVNGTASIALRAGKVVSIGQRLATHLQQRLLSSTPNLSAEEAVKGAAHYLGLPTLPTLRLLEKHQEHRFVYTNEALSTEHIPVQLVYYAVEQGAIHLAWDLSIYTLDHQHWWSIKMDAHTGALLDKADWVVHCQLAHAHCSENNLETFPKIMTNNTTATPSQYLVFPLPIESPNHGARALMTNPSDALASPFGWHDTDSNAGAEYTITRGNNVYAYEDRDSDHLPGFSPDGGSALSFQFPYNASSAPITYEAAAITNLFYQNNRLHDIWYHYGFNEASGNFQVNNYGRGGLANDGVIAEAQDGGGVSNATFAVPVDGLSPKMQLYLWGLSSNVTGYFLKVNSPNPLAGVYVAANADFGPGLPTVPLTTNLVLVEDSSFDHDACDPISNAAALAGNIALIDRGNCAFTAQVAAAEAAGAQAVIIIDNNTTGFPHPLTGSAPTIGIPAIMLGQTNGNAFKNQLLSQPINGSIQGGSIPHPIKDGDLDNGIIAHEYGHGISTRLVGGAANSNCLLNAEQMGEGWSDWFALMLTLKQGDRGSDARTIGSYVAGQTTTGTGIRIAPYSTDTLINGFTYGASNNASLLTGKHGVGFIFATVLWDLNWALVDYYGGVPDFDFHTGTGGNNVAMALVVESLKLLPCSPGMLDGRDAILQADQLLYGGRHRCLIWNTFAQRGFGFSASQGSPNSRVDQVEAFDVPNLVDFSFVNSSAGLSFAFNDQSLAATSWLWQFGDGDSATTPNPTHTYNAPGTYHVTLTIDSSTCSSSQELMIIFTSTHLARTPLQVSLAPNPSRHQSRLQLSQALKESLEIQVLAATGKICQSYWLPQGETSLILSTASLPAGIYFVQLKSNSHYSSLKLVVQ